MTISEREVLDVCRQIAPKYQYDPILIAAICRQETFHPRDNPKLYVLDYGRLEQRYYVKYVVERHEYATTTEILMAASYGLMQVLGDSLRQAGFFKDYFYQQDDRYRLYYGDSYVLDRSGNPEPWMSEVNVPKAINKLLVTPQMQVEWGCRWLREKQRLAGGDLNRAIDYYNGDLTGAYRQKVLKKKEEITREYGL